MTVDIREAVRGNLVQWLEGALVDEQGRLILPRSYIVSNFRAIDLDQIAPRDFNQKGYNILLGEFRRVESICEKQQERIAELEAELAAANARIELLEHGGMMPQATQELRARWDIDCAPVIAYLEAKGFVLEDGCWIKPSPDHELTEAEDSAIMFLFQEWDFGGVLR